MNHQERDYLDAIIAERDEARRERDDARLAFDIHDEALSAR